MELADKNLKRRAIINMLHMFKKVKKNTIMMWRKMEDKKDQNELLKKNPTCKMKTLHGINRRPEENSMIIKV